MLNVIIYCCLPDVGYFLKVFKSSISCKMCEEHLINYFGKSSCKQLVIEPRMLLLGMLLKPGC